MEAALAAVAGREPDAHFAAEVADECRQLFADLPDDEARDIARWKMEGFTNDEVAVKLGCATATVERRLRLVRKLWKSKLSK